MTELREKRCKNQELKFYENSAVCYDYNHDESKVLRNLLTISSMDN